MKKILTILIVGVFMMSLASAVWWNPFTWFDGEENVVIKKGGKWVQEYSSDEDFFLWIENSSKKKTEVCLLHDTATKLNDLAPHKSLYGENKKEIEQLNRKKKEIEGTDYYGFCRKIESDDVEYIKFGEHSTVATYEEEVLEVTNEKDEVIAEIILKTDDWYYKNNKPNVDYGVGNRIVHHFQINKMQNYSNIFDNIYFKDMKTDKLVERDFKLKYLIYEDFIVDDYENQFVGYETNGTERWEMVYIGNHTETKGVWYDLTQEILDSKDVIVVGVETKVMKGDYMDVGFDFAGVDVGVFWSTWTEDLNVDLDWYYTLNDSASNTDVIDSTGNLTATLGGGDNTVDISTTGKISTALLLGGSGDDIDTDSLGSNVFSHSLWLKRGTIQQNANHDGLISSWGGTTQERCILALEGSTYNLEYYCGTSLTSWANIGVLDTNWHHLVFTYNGSHMKIYVDGVLNVSASTTYSEGTSINWVLGNFNAGGSNAQQGTYDEWGVWSRALDDDGCTVSSVCGGEIEDLYNGGTGITYTDSFGPTDNSPSVTLLAPTNGANLTSANVDFTTTVTDDSQVANVTLYIDGVLNETNSSNVNGSYTFSKVVSEGLHNWSILAYDNASNSNQSATWTFNYTQPPLAIDLLSPTDASSSSIPLVNVSCESYDVLGVEQLNLTINGVVNTTVTNSTPAENLSLTLNTNFAEGNYTWGCSAYNQMTSASSSNRTFEVLYSNPIINLFSPANDSLQTSGSIDFTFNASDINGIGNVSLYVNSSLVETNSSGIDGDYTITDALLDGSYEWYIGAISIFGKTTFSDVWLFSIDTLAPQITITSPTGALGTLVDGQSLDLNYSITDANLNECWYKYNEDSPCYQESATTSNQTGIDGNCNLNYTGNNDVDGNWQSSTSRLVDGSFSSYSGASIGTSNFYVNYSLPSNYMNTSVWYVKGVPNETNLTIDNSCFRESENILQFRVTSVYNTHDTTWSCNNGTEWITLGFFDGNPSFSEIIYEEAMIWDIGVPLNCSAGHTTFNYDYPINNLTVYAKDVAGNTNSSTTTWSYNYIIVNQTYNSDIIVSEYNNFSIVIESFATSTTNPKFVYGGSTVTAELTPLGGDLYEMTSSFSTNDTFVGDNSFYWQLTFDGTEFSTTSENQTVSDINFSLCDAVNNVTYLSVDFLDELALQSVNATIRTSVFEYYLEDSSASKSYSYISASNQSQYDFCFDLSNETIQSDITMSYYGDSYPERTYGGELTLSNETTNLTLSLLDESSGIYANFQVVDSSSKSALGGVNIKVYDGSTLVLEKTTDDGGRISEWLNPNVLYTIEYSRTSYISGSQSIRPISTDTYTIEMTFEGSQAPDSIINNMDFKIYPQDTNLDANTTYEFAFWTSEGDEGISYMRFRLYDDNDTILGLAELSSDGNRSMGFINTSSNKTFKGIYEINGTDGGYYIFEQTYYITIVEVGEYSLFAWNQDFNSKYPSAERTSKTRLVWFILWFIIMLSGFTFGYNGSFSSQKDKEENVTGSARGNTTAGMFFAFIITLVFCYLNLIPIPISVLNPGLGMKLSWLEQNFMALIILIVLVWEAWGKINKHGARGS